MMSPFSRVMCFFATIWPQGDKTASKEPRERMMDRKGRGSCLEEEWTIWERKPCALSPGERGLHLSCSH